MGGTYNEELSCIENKKTPRIRIIGNRIVETMMSSKLGLSVSAKLLKYIKT